VTSEDETTVESISTHEAEVRRGDEQFSYPIAPITEYFPLFGKHVGKRLTRWMELVDHDNDELSRGVSLYFEDNSHSTIRDHSYPLDINEYLFDQRIPNDLKEVARRSTQVD
jgi:hypothetical protein